MRWLRRILIGIVLFNVLAVAAAQVAKRRLPSYGDQDSETFALVAAMDGIEFVSRSGALRAGSGTAVMGGMTIDLTEVQSGDAVTLDLKAIMGGIDVLVPADWRVEMKSTSIMGGTENLTDPDAAADDATVLIVDARAYLGGSRSGRSPRRSARLRCRR